MRRTVGTVQGRFAAGRGSGVPEALVGWVFVIAMVSCQAKSDASRHVASVHTDCDMRIDSNA